MRERSGQSLGPWSIACFACVALVLWPTPVLGQEVIVLPRTAPLGSVAPTPRLEPPPDLEGMTGAAVRGVAVVLDGDVWDVPLPPVTALKSGDLFTAARGRRGLEELLASGHFARGHVSAEAADGGVLVTMHVVPRRLVERLEVDLHGVRFDREEILREADLAEGGEIVGADIAVAKARVEHFFALHGYPAAQVDIRTRATADPLRASVLLDARSGPPRLFTDRHFYVFDAPPEEVATLTSAYTVKPKDRADEPAVDAADAALEQALRSKGWHRAVVSHDMVRMGEPGTVGRTILRVRIDTGPRQVPRFVGNDHYDADTLTAALDLEKDPDRTPAHLADKLTVFYQKHGFLDAEVRPEVRTGSQAAVQLLV
ncbi:MAG: hypothetical protein M3O36_08695, partial [Myxococcota bacterium]|nr:hypothetical protein [Myxococcota bacterium]